MRLYLTLAEEHKLIVISIVKREEQLAGFTQLLEVVARSTSQLEGFTGGLCQGEEVSQELKPFLARYFVATQSRFLGI